VRQTVTTHDGASPLGTFPVDFEEGDAARVFELRGHQGSDAVTADALGDFRIDDLTLTLGP
jgi:hypothetical protein